MVNYYNHLLYINNYKITQNKHFELKIKNLHKTHIIGDNQLNSLCIIANYNLHNEYIIRSYIINLNSYKSREIMNDFRLLSRRMINYCLVNI